MNDASVIAAVGALIFVSHFFVALFGRTRIPDVFLLTLIGLVLGPLTHLVTPDKLGAVGPVFATITLVLILFESGTGLRADVLQRSLKGTVTLSLLNFVVTVGIVAFATRFVAHLDWMSSFLLGTILGGTSPTTVVPLSDRLGMGHQSKTILFLESAVGDVLSIVVTLAMLQTHRRGSVHVGHVVGAVFASFIFAGVLGVTGALVWSVLLNKVRTMKNSLLTTIAFVFVIFGTAEFFGYSGAIAALAFGVTIGNIHLVDPKLLRRFTMLEPISLNEMERTFFSEVVFLLKTFFFVYIGVSITFRSRSWSLYALLVTALVFLFRLLATRLGTERSLPRPDAMRMAVMAPRGLAAAVLASLPLQANLPGGPMIQGVTYMVVLFSIGLTSVLVFLLDKTALRRLFAWIFSGSVEAPAGPEEGIDP